MSNTKMLVYLQGVYTSTNPNLQTLLRRRMDELTGSWNARFLAIYKAAA